MLYSTSFYVWIWFSGTTANLMSLNWSTFSNVTWWESIDGSASNGSTLNQIDSDWQTPSRNTVQRTAVGLQRALIVGWRFCCRKFHHLLNHQFRRFDRWSAFPSLSNGFNEYVKNRGATHISDLPLNLFKDLLHSIIARNVDKLNSPGFREPMLKWSDTSDFVFHRIYRMFNNPVEICGIFETSILYAFELLTKLVIRYWLTVSRTYE
jgi:hypothetical protein